MTGLPKAPGRSRGWGRSLLLAIGVHFALLVVLWRVAVRLGMSPVAGSSAGDLTATAGDRPGGSRLPPILRTMESAGSSPAPPVLAAFADRDESVDWPRLTQRRAMVDAPEAPLIGFPSPTDLSIIPLHTTADSRPAKMGNPQP